MNIYLKSVLLLVWTTFSCCVVGTVVNEMAESRNEKCRGVSIDMLLTLNEAIRIEDQTSVLDVLEKVSDEARVSSRNDWTFMNELRLMLKQFINL
jgi:hypothetical protein